MSTQRLASKSSKKVSKRKAQVSQSDVRSMVRKEIYKTMETKEYPYFLSSNALSTIDQLCINTVPQGDSAQTREGNRIMMSHISVKVAAVPLSTATGNQLFKWAVVLDKQSNGTQPAWSEITTQSVVTDPVLAPLTPNAYSRFQILATDTALIGHSLQQPAYYKEKFIPLKGLEAAYVGSGGSYTSLVTNAIWFYIIPSNQAFFSYGVQDAEYTMAANLIFKDN